MQQCQDFGFGAEAGAVRVIVTCIGVCTPVNGEVRIDTLQPDGTTRSMGQGSYSGAAAPPLIPEPEATPVSS